MKVQLSNMAILSIATYSLRNMIRNPEIGLKGIIEVYNKLNVSALELNNIYLTPEEVPEICDYYKEHGITPVQLTVDGNNFFQKKEKKRKEQFDFMKPWIDAAADVGMKYIRANMGRKSGFLIPNDTLDNLLATFLPILDYAKNKGLVFVFENHGGKSSDINFQLKVKERIPDEHFGYLLDCGNYNPKEQVYENILKLGDSIKVVHAKTYDFDEQGNETTLDYERIIANLKKIGYDGVYSVEFEGRNLSDEEGTAKTIQLLRKYLE